MGATMRVMENSNAEALETLRKTIKRSLSARIARAREDLQYSQGDVLAELDRRGLGRTQGSLSQIENGTRLPSVETLYVLAQYLDSSADYFLGLSNNALSPADLEEELATAKGEGKIDKLMNALGREQRAQVIAFAEYLLAQSGRAEEIARGNEAAWHAAANVLERKYGPQVNEVFAALADSFPQLARLIDRPGPEDKRIRSG